MNKLFLVAAVAVLGLSACKKDYTCTCEVLGTESVTEYEGLNKDDADTAEGVCNDANDAAAIVDGSCTWAQK